MNLTFIRAARAAHAFSTSISPCFGGALLCAALLTGCGAQLRAASAGQIGCSPDEVVIADNHAGWGSRTWKATCRGKDYSCSAVATGNNTSQVSCAPMADASTSTGGATPAAPVAAAATSDVGRELDAATQETRVRGKFQLGGGVSLTLIVAPRSAPGALAAVVEGASDGPLDQCRQLSALVNARPFAGEGVKADTRDVGQFGLRATFAIESMQGLDKPYAEFALQACERTWKLSAAQVEDLKKLLVIARDLAQESSVATPVPTPAPASSL
jgi:hypothetical protein